MAGIDWLEVLDPTLNADDIMQQVHDRLQTRALRCQKTDAEDQSRALWEKHVGRAAAQLLSAPTLPETGNITPANYLIRWRTPILGPIHGLIRRLINSEVRRYVDASLQKQSRINEQYRENILLLMQENQRLRAEIEALKQREPKEL